MKTVSVNLEFTTKKGFVKMVVDGRTMAEGDIICDGRSSKGPQDIIEESEDILDYEDMEALNNILNSALDLAFLMEVDEDEDKEGGEDGNV